MGGPQSRTRVERLSTTLLGREEGCIRCPRVVRVGLDFGRRSPFASVRRWLKACGFADELEARAAIALPVGPCICRADSTQSPVDVSTLDPRDALTQALILGLSTPWLYDPRRPVVWTSASLTRRLELFDGRGFYV